MSGAGNLNLSLLARGVGEVKKNGDKIEVKLEAADYFNWKDDTNRNFILPPIASDKQPEIGDSAGNSHSNRGSYETKLIIPKTFITRKGALLLFSEDLAKTFEEEEDGREEGGGGKDMALTDELDLRTVGDLANSILAYGSRKPDEAVCLKVIPQRDSRSLKIIRPGFSPRRYLASWTKFFDTNFVARLSTKGYLHEKNLYESNQFLPHIRYPVNVDLSNYPMPYRIMKQMLMSPGSLSGYTFYWSFLNGNKDDVDHSVPSDSSSDTSDVADEGVVEIHGDIDENDFSDLRLQKREKTLTDGAICVVQTDEDGLVREVSYAELDADYQQEVLTDLLVKSAISHALMKKEQQMEIDKVRMISPGLSVIESEATYSEDDVRERAMFDMVEAVQSLLDNRGSGVFDSRIIPDHEESQKTIRAQIAVKPRARKTSRSNRSSSSHSDGRSEAGVKSWPGERAYCGNIPVASLKESTSNSDLASVCSAPAIPLSTSLPQLSSQNFMFKRPDRSFLSPIKDVSCPPTRASVHLPPIVSNQKVGASLPDLTLDPPTPQHTTLNKRHLSRSISNLRQPTNTNSQEDKADGQKETSSDGEAKPAKRKKNKKDKLLEAPGPVQKNASQISVSSVFSSDLGSKQAPGDASIFSALPGKKAPDTGGFRSKSPSLKKRASNLHDDSNISIETNSGSLQNETLKSTFTGSVVLAPDGEVLPVGGTIDITDNTTNGDNRNNNEVDQSGDIHAELDILGAQMVAETDRFGNLTEEELLLRLREHAAKIAARVLRRFGAGKDLAKDAMTAATIWQRPPDADTASKAADSEDDDDDLILKELMKANGLTDLDPQSALYKELLRQALGKALNIDIPEDAIISDDLLAALASGQLNPDDIEIVFDPKTGKHIVRLKKLTAERLRQMPVEAQARILASLSLEERARLLASMTDEEKKKLLASLGMEEKAKLLAAMSMEEREKYLAMMTEEEKAALLRMLPPEERARLVAALTDEEREKYLATLTDEEKAQLLLSVSLEDRAKILASMSAEDKEKLLAMLSTEDKAKLIAAMSMEEREAILANMTLEEKEALLAALAPEEKARLIAALSEEERQQILKNMSLEEKAAILSSLSLKERMKVLNSLSEEDKQRLLNELPPDQKAKILAALSEEEREKFLANLSLEEKAELLRALSPESKAKLLASMSSEERAKLLAEMSVEEKAKLLQNLSAEEKAKLLASMSVEERAKVLASMSEEERMKLLDSLPPEERAKIIAALSKEEREKLLANMSEEEKMALLDMLSTEEKGKILAAMSTEERAKFLSNMTLEEKMKMLDSLGIEERAKLLEAMTAEEKMALLNSLPPEAKAKILAALSSQERANILANMTFEEKLAMLEALPPEERARILASLSKEERERLIALLPEEERAETLRALKSFLKAEKERSKLEKRPEFVVGKPKDSDELARLYGRYDDQNITKSSVKKTASVPIKSAAPAKAPPPSPEQSNLSFVSVEKKASVDEGNTEVNVPQVSSSSGPPPPGGGKPNKDVHMSLTLPKLKAPSKRKEGPKKKEVHSKESGQSKAKKPKLPKVTKDKVVLTKVNAEPLESESETPAEDEINIEERELTPPEVAEIEDEPLAPLPIQDNNLLQPQPHDEGRRESSDTTTSSLRAAQRAAVAEKRKREVEQKRREREAAKKKEQEEEERRERLKADLEEERREREEKVRLQREKSKRDRELQKLTEEQRLKRIREKADKERRMREEEKKRMEDFKRDRANDEKHKQALMQQKHEAERRRQLEEERMLYEMSERERMEYERKKKEEAERKAREEAEAKARREAEIAKAMEEARQLAEEMARRKRELEERMNFNRSLHVEAEGLTVTQDVSRSFVSSYFDLLQWLGVDLPKEGF
ncbi:uncharacterized protein LOC141899915 isoform X2 [Tubulanus polymorphus]|uniref:uncharacterized protein LOC141899915 isoform X2 n=1 Tax=Tubulanus polymorphus TaxID=672921 RepID=UPI003DA4A0FE